MLYEKEKTITVIGLIIFTGYLIIVSVLIIGTKTFEKNLDLVYSIDVFNDEDIKILEDGIGVNFPQNCNLKTVKYSYAQGIYIEIENIYNLKVFFNSIGAFEDNFGAKRIDIIEQFLKNEKIIYNISEDEFITNGFETFDNKLYKNAYHFTSNPKDESRFIDVTIFCTNYKHNIYGAVICSQDISSELASLLSEKAVLYDETSIPT